MNTHERVQEALHNYNFNENGNGINELIAYAYNLGRCEKSKELCDAIHGIFNAQHKRAVECRYHNFAEQIIGYKKDYIYDSDYDQWIRMFGTDKTEI